MFLYFGQFEYHSILCCITVFDALRQCICKQETKYSQTCVMTTHGTQNFWPLLTGGRCSEVALCYEN